MIPAASSPEPRAATGWHALPRTAQVYVASVIAVGAFLMVVNLPHEYPRPAMFLVLLVTSCLTSAWKVNLPLALASGSTLSVSYAANLMALILLGPQHAMLIAVAGVWTQCTLNVRRPYPHYRTIFSLAAEAITIQATGLAYMGLGGLIHPVSLAALPKAVVGAIVAYFIVNTGLVAGAIATSTRQRLRKIWHDDFLWSVPSFIVAGTAGAIAALIVERNSQWLATLMLAPVYLTYRTYRIFLGRIEDERRHVAETQKLHMEAVQALMEARRAEVALADEKERLAVTLRSIGDGVITTDLDGAILLINSAAETLTGWTQGEAAGQALDTVFRCFEPDTRARRNHAVSALAPAEHSGLTRSAILVARDLTERPIEEIAAPIRDAAGETIGMVIAFRNITEALKMQEERARAIRVESLGLLASGIANDFNNSLTAIIGNVSTARSLVGPNDPAALPLEQAEAACGRARRVTWQLLTFSKGGMPNKKKLALGRTVDASVGLALRGTNVAARFQIAPDLWPISADEDQLIQVFSNILSNAQQSMPHGGCIEVRAENVMETGTRWENALLVRAGPYVRVSITDKGIGIPEENLSRIFDPYFSTKQKGSGLGLAVSYSIVKNHGGCVSAESRLGRGTTLAVSLPALAGEQIQEPVKTAPAIEAMRGRILVMDVGTQAVNMLKFLGHDAEAVTTGTAALKRYRRALRKGQPYDAVILDLTASGTTEAIERLTAIDPAVNAIVVGENDQDPVMTSFKDYGFKAVIGKPFTLQELSSTLNSLFVTPRTWTVH